MNNKIYSDYPVQTITPERLLRTLGASGTLVGFRYAVYMVNRIIEDEDMLLLITKCLYPETARYFGVKACSVERSLRTLISACGKRTNTSIFETIAGRPVNCMPTNSEFLDMVSSYLKTIS